MTSDQDRIILTAWRESEAWAVPMTEEGTRLAEHRYNGFIKGWKAAIEHLTSKQNSCYTDIISDGGMDPR